MIGQSEWLEKSKVRYLHLTSDDEARDLLKGVEVDPCGIKEMLPKMIHINIMLEDIESKVANVIKKEMLSLGGDAAIAHDAVGRRIADSDVILMGTLKQINSFAEKIAMQSSILRKISERIIEILSNLFMDSVPLRTSRREITLGERTMIMGIINVTPDSFSDGGRFTVPELAVEEGIRMAEEGADMIDIGGESTRPGSDPVPQGEELRRVIPVIRGLAGRIDIPLSVDTMKAAVAREALAEGAEIVNDVSSMSSDEYMANVVADAGAAVILMHMRGTPKTMQTGDLTYRSLRGEIIAFLQHHIEQAQEKGIEPMQIMVDPGLGFGKTATDNLRLIRHLGELKVLGRPIVTGASRKSFIGHITGGGPQERIEGTSAAVTTAILNGSNVIRVHDVATMKKVAVMADALRMA
jgi:dihydropteroate synthase